MTFLEAALEILKREGRPLHFKELTERAMTKKLLTFVGRTPELTMQTQLTAAIKKAPGNPFVRVKPGTFGLLRYPEIAPEETPKKEEPAARASAHASDAKEKSSARTTDRKKEEKREDDGDAERGRRRRRRGGRGTRGGKESESESPARVAAKAAATPSAPAGEKGSRASTHHATRDGSKSEREPRGGVDAEGDSDRLHDRLQRETANEHPDEHMDDPSVGGLSAEARAAALAETGVLEGDQDNDNDGDGDGDDEGDDDVVGDEPIRAHRGGDPGTDRESNESRDDRTFASTPAAKSGAATVTGPAGPATGAQGDAESDGDDDPEADDDTDSEGSAFGEAAAADASAGELGDDPARRRRRRRRRRRGANGDGPLGEDRTAAPAPVMGSGAAAAAALPAVEASEALDERPPAGAPSAGGMVPATAGATDSSTEVNGQPARKILAPIDAAIEVLRSQPPGRGVHVRQIADSAIRKRLIHGEPNEAWRVIRTALATESKHRLRNGTRPRVRSAGSGLFALARRPPDAELEKAEHVFGEARRALRERSMAALEKRVAELPSGAFEALARVLLQREGFGPTTFVKRVDGTIYVEALRGRGSRPSRCLIALRAGGASAGRRAIGELRAGIRARNQDEGVLMLCGRLADDGIAEWKQPGPPLEIVDGAALAETCARHGVGVQTATVTVDFVDGDFFAELSEG